MLKRRAVSGLLLTSIAGSPLVAQAAPKAQLLFSISRSKNANVVHYAARTIQQGLDQAAPLAAYWLMLAEDGRREELSWTERKLAYGFSVSSLSPQGCRVSLVSFKERPIRVERVGSRFRALIAVQGRSAVLERIFVQASEGSVFPTVEHLDVFATGLDGTPLKERIARS